MQPLNLNLQNQFMQPSNMDIGFSPPGLALGGADPLGIGGVDQLGIGGAQPSAPGMNPMLGMAGALMGGMRRKPQPMMQMQPMRMSGAMGGQGMLEAARMLRERQNG